MKKTVIAAALASTVFSGAAMAWTANGTGGNIELSGIIQVTPYTTPWVVEVGAPVTTLDANITKGTKAVMIPVTKAIPVLGIRLKTKLPIQATPGISPQINFNGAVDLDGFDAGVTTLTLKVVKASDATAELGTLSAKFSAAAISNNAKSGQAAYKYSLYSPAAGNAFFGGISKTQAGALTTETAALAMLGALSSEYISNYAMVASTYTSATEPLFSLFNTTGVTYNGAYGAGIQSGSSIKLTLTNPAANDAIKWKASLPVTISYQ